MDFGSLSALNIGDARINQVKEAWLDGMKVYPQVPQPASDTKLGFTDGTFVSRQWSEINVPMVTEAEHEEQIHGLVETVVVGTAVSSIGDIAFQAMPSLHEIYIPQTCESMGEHVFRSSSNIRLIRFLGRPMQDVQTMANFPWDAPLSAIQAG